MIAVKMVDLFKRMSMQPYKNVWGVKQISVAKHSK